MVDLCLEAIQTTGPVSLFIGIESANWTPQQFTDAATFAKQHGITCIFLKVFEVGSPAGGTAGFWYGGMAGIDKSISLVKAAGVSCIPYGFLYGDEYGNLTTEIDVAKQLLSKYGLLCLDMEGGPWASPNAASWAKEIVSALEPIPGELWVSCPANPVESGQLPFLQAMVPATNVFMPMVYSDYLATKWQGDFKQVGAGCVQPTIDLSGEFGANNIPAIVEQIIASGAKALSIWEYQFATQYAGAFDAAVKILLGNQQPQGGSSVPLQLNSVGAVLDVLKTNQLIEGEPDLCGPWTASGLRLAGLPGKGARGTAEDVDAWTDNEVKLQGFANPADFPGSSIPQMRTFMTDAKDPQSGQRNLHWWEMVGTDPARIRKAVEAGYIVIVTAWEPNIIEKKTGQQAYTGHWQNTANHIFPIGGIDKDGDYICFDQLNNSFQGYWPPVYLANKLNPSWAAIVQVVGPDPNNPWLKAIPSDDPLNWPQGFNAQNFAAQPQPQPENQMQQQFDSVWSKSPFVPSGYKSGIYQDMLAAFLAKKISACFPTEDEIDWGNGVRFQPMSNGLVAKWAAGQTKILDAQNRQIA